ncbi:MAG: ribonucleoside-triphosphate reductase [Lachnospiraceae bacterium]|nr:ribonucleoside-triphosphate reductase [Lachnospiraceae bacterium]
MFENNIMKIGEKSMAGKVVPNNGQVGEHVKFDRIRRITGYLVGTTDRFNNAKRAEEKDRVKHSLS